MREYGEKIDYSRMDWMIAKAMAARYTVDQVAEVIREHSPNIEARKVGHLDDYARRTATKAAPEVGQVQRPKQRDRGYDGPSR
jgi:hypothetical protein